MENKFWNSTCKRFVTVFEIIDFKKLSDKNDHKEVLTKLELLKNSIKSIDKINNDEELKAGYNTSITKTIFLSDSIIIFSKADTETDALKIILETFLIIYTSLKNGIGIKGAISYGEITVDYDNSIFFGQAINDAYSLLEQLQIYSAVLDNRFEARLNTMSIPKKISAFIQQYKANFKTNNITHKLIAPKTDIQIKELIDYTNKMYDNVSGTDRIYIDNTLEFLNSLIIKIKTVPKSIFVTPL